MPHVVRLCRQIGRRGWSCRQCVAIFVLVALLPISLIEWSAFEVVSWFWGIVPSADGENASFSILLIGDPQLIGYRKEAGWIGPLSRWDSDRYLRRGYERVVKTVRPALEIFMGDLFDEGVEMDQQEFSWTMARFHRTFPSRPTCSRMSIPGDNDVGGEMEPVYSHLIRRFEQTFSPHVMNTSRLLDHLSIAHLDFFNNYQLQTLHEGSSERKLRLLLSHMPILRSAFHALSENINAYHPSLIVSAHDHMAEAYTTQRRPETAGFKRIDLSSSASSHSVDPSQLTELQVPTVSYRMGVSHMGYGLLSVHLSPTNEGDPRAKFRILWLPPRYPLLLLYLSLILFSIIGLLFVNRPRVLSLTHHQRFAVLVLANLSLACSPGD